MASMTTSGDDSQKRKPAEPAQKVRGGIKLGLAEGMYELKADFDRKFDDMDAEIAELFG